MGSRRRVRRLSQDRRVSNLQQYSQKLEQISFFCGGFDVGSMRVRCGFDMRVRHAGSTGFGWVRR